MKSILRLREEDRQEAGKVMGVNYRSLAKIFGVQVKSIGHESDAFALPVQDFVTIQVTDPDSPDFGAPLFVPGISVPGDGSIIP